MPARRGNDKLVYITFGAVLLIAIAVILIYFLTRKTCPADIKIDTSTTDITLSQLATFTDKTVGKITQRDWDFGDDSPHGHEATAIHKYAKEGSYTVTLKLNNRATCISVVTVNVAKDVVIETPVRITPVIQGPNPPVVYVGRAVKFKDATPGATSWEWYFENGKDILNVKEPAYTFLTPGDRTVSLVVNGNSDRSDFKIKVLAAPVAHKTARLAPDIQPASFKQMLYDLRTQIRQITDFKPYFCDDLTKKISVNGQPEEFQSFCKEFMLSDNSKITALNIQQDPDTKCIIDIQIQVK